MDGGDNGEGGGEASEDANTSEQGLLTACMRSTPFFSFYQAFVLASIIFSKLFSKVTLDFGQNKHQL